MDDWLTGYALLLLQLSEHSPSPQRYGLSAAGAHDHHDQCPSASSTRSGSGSVSLAVLVAATGHSHHARREVMMMRCCWGEIDRARAPPTGHGGHGQDCARTRRVVGDRQRPGGGGGGGGGGYRPRLLLSRRRTRRDGKDRRTCYSACNGGASGGCQW
jgi:hypothetical protein